MRNPKLEAMKWLAIEKLKQDRDAVIISPIDGVDVSTERSREDLKGAYDYFDYIATGGFIPWTLADNTIRKLNKEAIWGVITEFVKRKGTVFTKYQALRSVIESADSEDIIETIEEL